MTTDTLEALREAREALARQTENMAFVLNRVDLPEAWFANFNNELALSRTTLSRIDAALAPDHIGNSTTMVPTPAPEEVARIIFDATYDARHGSTSEMEAFWSRCDEAARAIIAAMEKNDGKRLGPKQLGLLRRLGTQYAMMVTDKLARGLVSKGMMAEAEPGFSCYVTSKGLRAVADALDAGKLDYPFTRASPSGGET